jgi:tRNA(Ile2) C34 agmatinyltransferase TiaS
MSKPKCRFCKGKLVKSKGLTVANTVAFGCPKCEGSLEVWTNPDNNEVWHKWTIWEQPCTEQTR